MELEYEHIDWSDIVEAELSGDQETLRKLRSVEGGDLLHLHLPVHTRTHTLDCSSI